MSVLGILGGDCHGLIWPRRLLHSARALRHSSKPPCVLGSLMRVPDLSRLLQASLLKAALLLRANITGFRYCRGLKHYLNYVGISQLQLQTSDASKMSPRDTGNHVCLFVRGLREVKPCAARRAPSPGVSWNFASEFEEATGFYPKVATESEARSCHLLRDSCLCNRTIRNQ